MTKPDQPPTLTQEQANAAALKAIKAVRLSEFRKCDFFGSNKPTVIPWTQDQFTSA